MADLFKLAEDFEKFTKTAAGGLSRKDIQKELEAAKKSYLKEKTRYDSAKSQMASLEKDISDANDKMETSKKSVLRNHDLLRNMDLSGAEAVKHFGDDVAYIKDKKFYLVTVDGDGNCKMTPYDKPEKKSKKDEAKEDKADVNDTNDLYSYLYRV